MTEDVIVDAETGEIIEPLRAAAQQGSAFDNLPPVVPTNQSVTLFGTDNPVEVIERSSAVASALADLIEQRKLFAVISGRKHVLVEGWTMLGSMLGVFPVMETCNPVTIDGVHGFEATVAAQTREGQIVGRASALCMRSERTWKARASLTSDAMGYTLYALPS